ncbi:plasmid replication, integration and excision activator [uncultured Cellulomonas sp.]|uniref:plasmid replication, integration and excision activator n=1 Tax=uncultured Cellulomonas sp. TaxID=189682 RepID=UPI0026255929|nr:plasmid replication, integration and excision activator [uncultured Cellulomonas sp.]
MALARRFKVAHNDVFPMGAYLVSEVTPVHDFEKSTRETKVQDVDKDSGLPVWSVDVLDADPDAPKKSKTVTVKIAAKHQPVPPANDGASPFTLVIFENLTATPWVDSSRCAAPEPGRPHRCRAQSAWSFRADGMASAKSASSTSFSTKVA